MKQEFNEATAEVFRRASDIAWHSNPANAHMKKLQRANEVTEDILTEVAGVCKGVILRVLNIDNTFLDTSATAQRLKDACDKGDVQEALDQMRSLHGEPGPGEYIARLEAALARQKTAEDVGPVPKAGVRETQQMPKEALAGLQGENTPSTGDTAHPGTPSTSEAKTVSDQEREACGTNQEAKKQRKKASGADKGTVPTQVSTTGQVTPETGRHAHKSMLAVPGAEDTPRVHSDLHRLCIRSGKQNFLPLESLDSYAKEDGVIVHLKKIGMISTKKVAGHKVTILSDLFKSSRCGRIIWAVRREDFMEGGRDILEAVPVFALTLEAAKRLVDLFKRCNDGVGSSTAELAV